MTGIPPARSTRGRAEPEAMEFIRWTPMALPYVLLDVHVC